MENLLEKISKIQTEIEGIIKNAENPFFNSTYADLNNIKEHLRPYLIQQNLMVYNYVESESLKTIIYDKESKESLVSSIELTQKEPQKKGAEITYYRRYNLITLFDLKIEDDDANITTKKINNIKYKDQVNVWLTESQFNTVLKKDNDYIKQCLLKYDGKTKQEDDKVYGMKKEYRDKLEQKIN